MRTLTIGPDMDVNALVGKQVSLPFGVATVLRAVRATHTYQGLSLLVTCAGKETYWGGDDGDTITVLEATS